MGRRRTHRRHIRRRRTRRHRRHMRGGKFDIFMSELKPTDSYAKINAVLDDIYNECNKLIPEINSYNARFDTNHEKLLNEVERYKELTSIYRPYLNEAHKSDKEEIVADINERIEKFKGFV